MDDDDDRLLDNHQVIAHSYEDVNLQSIDSLPEWFIWSYLNVLIGGVIFGLFAIGCSLRTHKFKRRCDYSKARKWSHVTFFLNLLTTLGGLASLGYCLFRISYNGWQSCRLFFVVFHSKSNKHKHAQTKRGKQQHKHFYIHEKANHVWPSIRLDEVCFSFFVTIGWHLWTASDKETLSHIHTDKKTKQFTRFTEKENDKRKKTLYTDWFGMYEVCSIRKDAQFSCRRRNKCSNDIIMKS